MSIRLLSSLCLVTPLLFDSLSTTARAQEVVIVTGPEAHLYDEQENVVGTVPFYHVFRVTEDQSPYLVVQHNGAHRRIHEGMVHRTSRMAYLDADKLPFVRSIFDQLRLSSEAFDEGDDQKAQQFSQAALTLTRQHLGRDTPLEPWILQYEAWLSFAQEDFQQAHDLLDECDAILKKTGQERHFQAADVFNVRAMILQAEGHTEEAIELFQRSLQIVRETLGDGHHDYSVICENLSYAYEELENYEQAAVLQESSIKSRQQVVSETAASTAAAVDRLGDLLRQNEQHEKAIAQYNRAVSLYRKHNPDQLTEIADLLTDIIYSQTQAEDFAGANRTCQALLDAVVDMEPETARYYRRDAILRLGTVDYTKGDFDAAMEHYEEAAKLANPESYHFDDGAVEESIGDTYLQQKDADRAKSAYERAITIYAKTEGADSDAVLNLRDYVNDIDSVRDKFLGGVVQVAMPRGYLLDDEGNIMDTIPGLTVLDWYSANDDFHEVQFKGKLGRLYNTQLFTRRNLPGYGVAEVGVFRSIQKNVALSFKALMQNQMEDAPLYFVKAMRQAQFERGGKDSSLYLWLQIGAAGVQMRTEGPDAAMRSLQSLQESVDAMNPDAYPIAIDYHNARAGILREQGQADAAAAEYVKARDIAAERLGQHHAAVLDVTRSLGKVLFRAGKQDDAIAELQSALAIAEAIYPEGSRESSDLVSEISIALTESGSFAKAAKLLEEVLSSGRKFPRETHTMLVATLGRAYARLDRPDDAKELLDVVVNVLTNAKEDVSINCPAGMTALVELGRLHLKSEQWQQAVSHLERAIGVINHMHLTDSFEASEVHKDLAKAYAARNERQKASDALKEVLRIYEGLGGGDSPQAAKIRLQMQEMTAEAEDPQQIHPFVNSLFDLTPDDQQMLVLKTEVPVSASPDENEPNVIATLETDRQVWSLEFRNGFHRIYLEDKDRYGWIRKDQVAPVLPSVLQKGRDKLQKELSNEPPSALQDCLNAFAAARPDNGFADPTTAIDTIEKSLGVIQSHYKYSNGLSGLLYEDLLQQYQMTGELRKLTAAAEESLKHVTAAYGYFHPAVAEVRMLRARHYQDMGDLSDEAGELDEIVRICTRQFGPLDPRTCTQQLGLASSLIRRGFFSRAIDSYRAAMESQTGDTNGAVFLRGVANLGMGGIHASERSYSTSARHLEKAVEEFTAVRIPAPSLMAQALIVLAWCKAEEGEPHEALSLLEQAAELPLSDSDASVKLSIMNLQARVAAEDVGSGADSLAAEAIDFATETFGADHFFAHDARQALGRALMLSDPERSAKAFDSARQLVSACLSEHVRFLPSGRQISFLASDRRSLDEALTLAFMEGGETIAESAANWLINSHQRLPELLAKERQISARLQSERDQDTYTLYSARRRARADVPLKFQAPLAPPTVQDGLAKLKKEEAAFLDDLPDDVQQSLTEQQVWLTCDDIRQHMRINEVLVVIRKMPYPEAVTNTLPAVHQESRPDVYAAMIIPAKDKVRLTLVGMADPLEGVVDQALKRISHNSYESVFGNLQKSSVDEETSLLKELGRQLWRPIAAKLPAKTQYLTLCLDGALKRVPWVALPDENGNSLIDNLTIRHVSNPREMADSAPTLKMSAPVMMYAASGLITDPAVAQSGKDQLKRLSKQSKGSPLAIEKKAITDALDFEAILPQGELETAGFADDFGKAFGGTPEMFESSAASEYRYFKTRRPQALHITACSFAAEPHQVDRTDAFSISEARTLISAGNAAACNPLTHCGLLLAGFSRNDNSHHLTDGVLTAEEIASQDLRGTELVTLSVCASPVNGTDLETEFQAIIPHAFRLAGAKSVLSSRWPQDEETRIPLLKAFYRNLAAGMEKAVALRQAQLEVRKSAIQNPGRQSVASWAGFQLTGSGWSAPDNTEESDENSPAGNTDSPLELARRILKLYRQKNIRELLALTADGPPTDDALKSFAPGTSRYESLFGDDSWRFKAVTAWNGELTELYYTAKGRPASQKTADTVQIKFGQLGSEAFVVTLTRENKKWVFDDVHSPDINDLKK